MNLRSRPHSGVYMLLEGDWKLSQAHFQLCSHSSKDGMQINPAEQRIFAGFQLVSDSSVNYQQLLDNEPIYKANVS